MPLIRTEENHHGFGGGASKNELLDYGKGKTCGRKVKEFLHKQNRGRLTGQLEAQRALLGRHHRVGPFVCGRVVRLVDSALLGVVAFEEKRGKYSRARFDSSLG